MISCQVADFRTLQELNDFLSHLEYTSVIKINFYNGGYNVIYKTKFIGSEVV